MSIRVSQLRRSTTRSKFYLSPVQCLQYSRSLSDQPLNTTTASRSKMSYKSRVELPNQPNRLAWFLGASVVGLSTWAAFLLYATNLERVSSSVTRQVIANIKHDEAVLQVFGFPITLPTSVIMFGEPWISGSVNLPAGHVDLSFRITGSKQSGTVYFTSVRKEKGITFTIIRFKIIADDGRVVSLLSDAT